MKILAYLLLFCVLSCQYFTSNAEQKIVVEFKGNKLYQEDLAKILPATYTSEDSINIVEPFIQNWLKKKVTVNAAATTISPQESENLDKQIIQYRDDLILNKFYNEQLKKLNENDIPEQEIIKYYHENERSFTLDETLVKTQYIVSPIAFKIEIEENIKNSDTLKNLCKKIKEIECFSSDEWINYKQSLTTLGLNEGEYSLDKIQEKPMQKFQKGAKFYVVKWTDFRMKGEDGPYEYYKNTIKSILINKRKLNLQKHIEDSLYNDAITNNKIKFYE